MGWINLLIFAKKATKDPDSQPRPFRWREGSGVASRKWFLGTLFKVAMVKKSYSSMKTRNFWWCKGNFLSRFCQPGRITTPISTGRIKYFKPGK